MASRSTLFAKSLITGYGNIATSIVFTIASIPLALHYLGKSEFGLWALASQINGYLQLVDLGMTGAVSRFVADYKDDVNGGDYGTCLVTGGLVFLMQGLFVVTAGLAFAYFAPEIFAIPQLLRHDFSGLLALLACTLGFNFAVRIVSAPLWAFQRFDVLNSCASLGLLINLGVLWLGFKYGLGVYALGISQIPLAVASVSVHIWICVRNGYYPKKGAWGRPKHSVFKKIFHYGKDLLLLSIGGQLINGTQIMIISRTLGLDAAAAFSIGTKVYTMAMQFVGTIINSAGPGLTELFVRSEHQRFVQRFRDLILMTLAVSSFTAFCLAAGNSAFIAVWVAKAVSWSWKEDLLLAILVISKNITGCFISIFGSTKDLKSVRHVYFYEGILFVPVAILLAKPLGIAGILAASIIAHLAVTFIISAKAASKVIGSMRDMTWRFIAATLILCAGSGSAWIASLVNLTPIVRLACAAAVSLVAVILILKLLIPESMRDEISARSESAIARIRARV